VDVKKLAIMATFAFVITGIVVYQVRSTRTKSAGAAPAGGNSAVPIVPAQGTQPVALPAVSTAEVMGEAPKPAVEPQGLSIPPSGWGRSPFLTVEEIRELNEPAAPTPVTAPVEQPPVVEALPQYIYRGTLSSRGRATAFINDRTYRVGDQIGKEVVTEITEEAVTLEFNGKRRKLSKAPAGAKPGI
jgi:hypothetical protein